MSTRISLHNIVKIERTDSKLLKICSRSDEYYKHIEFLFTDENGNTTSITVFSDDLSLGIKGVKS